MPGSLGIGFCREEIQNVQIGISAIRHPYFNVRRWGSGQEPTNRTGKLLGALQLWWGVTQHFRCLNQSLFHRASCR